MSQYFKDISTSVQTLLSGLKITFGYLKQSHKSREPYGIFEDEYFSQNEGLFTLQYPHEMIPVPDNGRYRLHNEIDDCIVCDKCAKVCPVDCIEIEPIRAVDTIGLTSDGTPKRIHAAKFDINMSKCCFCGLCTTVCPTECLTMTKTFDFSEVDVRDHTYEFSEMSLADIALKQKELNDFQKAKEQGAQMATEGQVGSPKPRPMPRIKPAAKPQTNPSAGGGAKSDKPKAVFKPRVVPKPNIKKESDTKSGSGQVKPKVVVKPKQAPKPEEDKNTPTAKESQAKPAPRPKFKPRPMIPKKPKEDK